MADPEDRVEKAKADFWAHGDTVVSDPGRVKAIGPIVAPDYSEDDDIQAPANHRPGETEDGAPAVTKT